MIKTQQQLPRLIVILHQFSKMNVNLLVLYMVYKLEIWISFRCYLFDLFETGECSTVFKGSRENTADGLDIVILYNRYKCLTVNLVILF